MNVKYFDRSRSTTLALLLSLLGLLGSGLTSSALAISDPEQARNDDRAKEISALIGTHNFAFPLSFSPDPFVGLPAGAVALGANIGLKHIRAPFVQPDGWARAPSDGGEDDTCHYTFDLAQSEFTYSNLLGLWNTKPVPATWSDLGNVDVAHANSDVRVSVNNPYITRTTQKQEVKLPEGVHKLTWKAETQISDIFDIVIPAAILTVNSARYGAAWANKGASAARADTIATGGKEAVGWMAVTAGLITTTQLAKGLPSRTAATEEREQTLTIYDINPPSIESAITDFTFEALDFGGLMADRTLPDGSGTAVDSLKIAIDAEDECGRAFSLSNDAPRLLPIGTTPVTWTVTDLGPNRSGGRNTDSVVQYVTIEDTQEPIMVPPPGRVIEVGVDGSGQQITSIDASGIDLGRPLVVDLADPNPTISNDGPAEYLINTRNPITWSATDDSDNAAVGTQLITVKAEGTNTAPTVANLITAQTLTSDPVDIRLNGIDTDIIDGIADPLSFLIEDRPANGEFVAPLFPFFIEDYRTSPEGPFGEEFRLTNNRSNWVYDNYCRTGTEIPVDWVYKPRFVQVTDSGTHYILDNYWWCNPSNSELDQRISKWDRDGNFLGQRFYSGTNDAFVLDRDEMIYTSSRNGAGSSTSLNISRCPSDFTDRFPSCDSWKIDSSSAPLISASQLSYARVDSNQQVLYVNDRGRIFAFDIDSDRSGDYDEVLLATMNNGERVIGSDDSASCSYGSSWTGFAMEVDTKGALYVADSCQDRVHKFAPSYFDESGTFIAGDYLGWLGKCDGSINKACDLEKGTSKGYSCTNATCSINDRVTSGSEPGQFDTPVFMALDPNDTLYIADSGNLRIQRFAEAGSFAGEAISTGTGINRGDRPSFVLGNMGSPKNVTVNSTQFYVVDQQEDFVNVFETTPFKEITDNAVTVSYVSNFDFHSATDTFTYRTTDGLAASNLGVVEIDVARNYRPPVAVPEEASTDEDIVLETQLSGDDPDGLLGIDFNGLDTLTFGLAEEPAHGTVQITATGLATYTPDPDYAGDDSFSFTVNDGRFQSESAQVRISINPLADPPKVRALDVPERIGAGFPFLLNAEYVDDGAEEPQVAVLWGDGSAGDVTGNFFTDDKGTATEDDDEARLIGVKLLPPPLDQGEGRAVAQHTYTGAGSRSIVYCMTDHGEQNCQTKQVNVERLVSLEMTVESDAEEFSDMLGATVSVDITNRVPTGIAGLPANNVQLIQEASSKLKLDSFTDQPGGCGLPGGGLDCDLGTVANGQNVAFSFRLSAAEPLIYDEDVQLRLGMTTDSQTVADRYTSVIQVRMLADATDSDADGMSDRFESRYGVSSPASDSDADGLSDLAEYNSKTNPTVTDSDGDGLSDGAEANTFGSDPTSTDSDGDGMPDGWEVDNQLNPVLADSEGDADSDGLSNAQEFEAGTDANNPDSDEDGIADGSDANPTFGDTDLDGIANSDDPDDDNDGLADMFEDANGLDRLNPADALADTDGDGYSNAAEHQAGSNLNTADSVPATEAATLAASVLPLNRSAVVGETVTAFATIINAATQAATNCSFVPLRPMAGLFSYQTTDRNTNAVTGAPNVPVNIPAGELQTFVFSFTPAAEMNELVEFRFDCADAGAATTIEGVNTFRLSASTTPTADVIALVGTLSNDGIVAIPGVSGASAMSVATVNVGSFDTITATANTGDADLPLAISLCETDPVTAACVDPSGPASSVVLGVGTNETSTFSLFVTALGEVPFDPANHRIFINFEDASGVLRGSTSVAVRTDR